MRRAAFGATGVPTVAAKKVFGCGVLRTSGNKGDVDVLESGPASDSPWKITVLNATGILKDYTAYAIRASVI
jgi:hypothetical protein